jgi:glutathione S-transferase
MMKLHWSPRSPYVRKVMVVAYELGLTDRLEIVRTVVGGTAPHFELMRENPLGKIPTLVLEDGTVLYDSPVICEYLDTLHRGPRLFPPWPDRLTALRRLALGDGMVDVALLWISERFRRPELRSAPHMSLWEQKIQCCVNSLEQEAQALMATSLTIGHLAIGIALSYLDFRFGELRWRDGHPGLAQWHAAFDGRPSMLANPPIDDR